MKAPVLALLVLLVPASLASFTATFKSAVPSERYGAYLLGDDTLANEARNAGLSYIVRQFRWDQIEPEQDVFNFNQLDAWIDDVLEPNDLSTIITIRTGQTWATDTTFNEDIGTPLPEFASTPPLDYDDYYDFIFRTVDHVKGRVDHFIIENDVLAKVQWYGTPEQFKQLTSVAYQAAKDADPECIVLGNKFPAVSFGHLITRDLLREGRFLDAIEFWNGYFSRREESFQVETVRDLLGQLDTNFSWWMDEFANGIMTADQAENLDVIAYNFYAEYEYIDDVLLWLYNKMSSNGFILPLWDLEHGVKDERDEVPDVQAAGELVKGYAITRSFGIPYIAWYPFTIDSAGLNFDKLKPMYDFANEQFLAPYFAMQIFSDHITPAHMPQNVLELDYSRYTFKNVYTGKNDVDIIWSDVINGFLEVPFRPGATSAVVTHYLGSSIETIPNVDDTLVMDLNVSPRYIRWLFE